MRILIAEDDPALASFVRKDLEAEHYAGCFSGRRAGARHSRELLEADDAAIAARYWRWRFACRRPSSMAAAGGDGRGEAFFPPQFCLPCIL